MSTALARLQLAITPHALIALCVLIAYGVVASPAWAQSLPDTKPPVMYVPPQRGARQLRVDHVEGLVVVAVDAIKWYGPASGIRIALFDAKHAPVATVVSGKEKEGQFEIKEVAPGAYTLVVGADKLDGLSVPLLVRQRAVGSELETAPEASLLQLIIQRAPEKAGKTEQTEKTNRTNRTNRKKSVASLIAHPALRTELLERVEKDQAIRRAFIQSGLEHPDKEIVARMTAIDADNLARMQEIVSQYGWPDPALVGVDGTDAAFLMVQHGSQAFQKEMLPLVRRAYRSGKLSGQSYALLQDRVLVRDGKPQIYGTQTRPFAEWQNGEPALCPIEDEAHVDQRRAQVGMFPLAEYVKLLKETYFPPAKGKP